MRLPVLTFLKHPKNGLPGVSILLVVMVSWMGCTNSGSTDKKEFLVRVRNSTISVGEFNKAFEIAKSAYTHNDMQNPPAHRAARQRLLNQLTEELILVERAKDLDIHLTDSEIESAVADIKRDYPEGGFEKMLLELAVSYPTWKKRLARRLLMEKVIDEELQNRISIEPDEILAYYDALAESKAEKVPNTEDIIINIVAQLRRKKAEDAFTAWIKTLQNEYTIEINQKQWKKLQTFNG